MSEALRIPIPVLGFSLGVFTALSFLLCVALGLVLPSAELHKPWLQFLPGFEWLTWRGLLIGLVWTQVYSWYTAIVFGWLFNTFATRAGARR